MSSAQARLLPPKFARDGQEEAIGASQGHRRKPL
jgi:hypothetical protein